MSQWYLLTDLSSHPADLEIIIIKRSLNQVLRGVPVTRIIKLCLYLEGTGLTANLQAFYLARQLFESETTPFCSGCARLVG